LSGVWVEGHSQGTECFCGGGFGAGEKLYAERDVRKVWRAGAVCDGMILGADMPSSQEEMRKALKAFKKRMKMTQLDDDSKLGHSPLSKGAEKIVSIQPPAGFGKEIWEELADGGYLKRDGIGFFELVPGKQL